MVPFGPELQAASRAARTRAKRGRITAGRTGGTPPITMTVQINRNYSFNTILPAVTLDLLDDKPLPYYQSFEAYQKIKDQRKKDWEADVSKERLGASVDTAGLPEDHIENRMLTNLKRLTFTNTQWCCVHKEEYYPVLMRRYWQQEQILLAHNGVDRNLDHELAQCFLENGLYAEAEQNLGSDGNNGSIG